MKKKLAPARLRLSRETLSRISGGWGGGTRTIVMGGDTDANSCQAGCNTSTDSNCTDNCPTWWACTTSGANC